MREIAAAKFKEQCLSILDNVDRDGIIITKRGKPVAKLLPLPEYTSNADLIGILEGEVYVDPEDDLSTGAWISDKWDDLNSGASGRQQVPS